MFFGGLLMFGSRLGDRLGHRRTIVGSLVTFAAGAVAAVMATGVLVLAAARCLQGAAAAGAVPSALGLLTTVTRPERRARALAAWSASGAAAGASGFVVGGLVTAVASWRVVFAAFVVVAALLMIVVLRWVPSDDRVNRRRGLNAWGSALLTLAVMTAVTGSSLVVEPPRRVLGSALLIAAAALSVTFVAVMGIQGARRGRKPFTTTPAVDGTARPADLVQREFSAPAPNRLWLCDITYIRTWSGTVYVSFVIDCFARMIVGWQASHSLRTALAQDALEQAIWARNHEGLDDLVHHSDRGSNICRSATPNDSPRPEAFRASAAAAILTTTRWRSRR